MRLYDGSHFLPPITANQTSPQKLRSLPAQKNNYERYR
jgi:hypothetical protein